MPFKILSSLLSSVRKEEREGSLLKNGSTILEDLIASCDGKYNPIRCYSADEIIRATNNFDPSCAIQYYAGEALMYRGFVDGQSVIVSRLQLPDVDTGRSKAIRDIVVLIQMSKHKNVLKLLGYSLEFPVPALVLEYATKGALLTHLGGLGDNESLPWKTRLRIAKQVANALTCLHTALPTPIIYNNLKPSCIVLDNDYVPKLCNFSFSITLPPKQLQVVEGDLIRVDAYLDPAHIVTGFISQKSDVYGFGVLLLVLLTGLPASGDQLGEHKSIGSIVRFRACDEQIQTIVDPKIFEEVGGDGQVEQQLRDFLALALLCTKYKSEERPYMIDVAKELVRIEKSILPC